MAVDVMQRDPATAAALITARLDRLPMTRHMWFLTIMIGAGTWFEYYDLFFSGYIAPGLFQSKLFTATTVSFFGTTGLAGFLASLFTGLFIGTILFSGLADRYGRRAIFTWSLIWYSVATVILAFQDTASGLNFWRLVGGIGIGVQMVTVDAYVSELAPKHARGKAFSAKNVIGYLSSPVIALLAWLLVPMTPLGLAGWRWVVLFGSLGAIPIWWVRMTLPESPRWLAQKGRIDEAERAMAAIEAKVAAQYGQKLPPPSPPAIEEHRPGRYAEIFGAHYRSRTMMLMVVNFFQTIGYYGFISWIPTLLIAKGIHITQSMQYTFLIALLNPVAPLVYMPIADRYERKWQVAVASLTVAAIGTLFAQLEQPVLLVLVGCVQMIAVNWMANAVHNYQSELFPTRVRARGVGFVYSWSRFSTIFSGFFIAFFLRNFGVPGVFLFIAGAMAVVIVSVLAFGPRSTKLALEEISP